ncbi:cupin domain-containing protein [Azospirillum sp.]|uniref:cupin domain-containing protein n=1 Tax=Azospirillum sp. TaxID=34012 RepID=UPI003D73D299
MTAESTAKTLDTAQAPSGALGRKHLASGKHVAMRLWDVAPGGEAPAARRDHETVGFVIGGRAELHIEGQVIQLRPGDSWVVPKGAEHAYRILERFQAVEATAPPAPSVARDELSVAPG